MRGKGALLRLLRNGCKVACRSNITGSLRSSVATGKRYSNVLPDDFAMFSCFFGDVQSQILTCLVLISIYTLRIYNCVFKKLGCGLVNFFVTLVHALGGIKRNEQDSKRIDTRDEALHLVCPSFCCPVHRASIRLSQFARLTMRTEFFFCLYSLVDVVTRKPVHH